MLSNPYWTNNVSTLYHADARTIPLADASVHCVVTSPPYWGLRDYGLKGGIGLESTLWEYIENLVAVMREVRRVLRDDGTVWLNLGDAYWGGKGASSSTSEGHARRTSPTLQKDYHHVNAKGYTRPADRRDQGFLPKTLIGQPWRVAFALHDDGWILRSAIVWHKVNPMPESVQDRPTSAYEMVFLLAKQGRYFYDQEAIRQPNTDGSLERLRNVNTGTTRRDASTDDSGIVAWHERNNGTGLLSGANARNVWTIPTQGRRDAHFATFPDELPRRAILAGTSEKGVCSECGAPWKRVTEPINDYKRQSIENSKYDHTTQGGNMLGTLQARRTAGLKDNGAWGNKTTGWQPTCECAAPTVPAIVLDPFVGSGTTVAVAQQLGRRSVGLDLNMDYLAIAKRRVENITLPMQLE